MPGATWTIPGSDGEPIRGNSHRPTAAPSGVVLIAHGFKGYKDYGMFPRVAQAFADAGFVAHRFNFSHSGMSEDTSTFGRPDLFERDTWNRQAHDLNAVLAAVRDGRLGAEDAALPVVLFGHSRGGVSCLLAAGRLARDQAFAGSRIAGIITAAAPSRSQGLADADAATLRAQGFLDSPSSRTGQVLRVGRAWLEEQEAAPEDHDLLALVGRIPCPILVVHGGADPTVPAESAERIAAAARDATVEIIEGANHVFDTPNPLPENAPTSPALARLLAAGLAFARERA